MRDEVRHSGSSDERLVELQRRNEKLAKINAALMQRVERSMEHQANAYSMFQTAIGLEAQVRVRTDELNTALNRLERVNDQLVAARDAAERANRFKTRFFTAVGHDLLQPLHAARLSLSAIAEGTQAAVPERLIAQVDHALSTIEELLRTILDLSKLEAGAMRPSIQSVALAELFRAVTVDLEPLARNKKLILTTRPTSVAVASDPLMLRRILQNLLANAVQYTVQGRVLLTARRRGGAMRIDVWDTGPGIAVAEQSKIFEEYHRGSAAEQSHEGGFGIGLAIIMRMAEALGHKIELCSRTGRGTRFSIYAPIAERTDALGAGLGRGEAALQAYGLAGLRVLVIDAEATVRDAMQDLLARWGCDARFATTIEGARAAITEHGFQPDLIVAGYDANSGGEASGIEMLSDLRTLNGGATATVLLAEDHDSGFAEAALLAGCEVLRKPVKPAELRALVMHLLG